MSVNAFSVNRVKQLLHILAIGGSSEHDLFVNTCVYVPFFTVAERLPSSSCMSQPERGIHAVAMVLTRANR